MLNFTRQEKLVLIFLGAASLVGIGADLFFKRSCPPNNIYSAALVQPSAKIDINKATFEQLVDLPGIGTVLAQRIIDYRLENGPFKKLGDIQSVKGISHKLYQRIIDLLTLTP